MRETQRRTALNRGNEGNITDTKENTTRSATGLRRLREVGDVSRRVSRNREGGKGVPRAGPQGPVGVLLPGALCRLAEGRVGTEPGGAACTEDQGRNIIKVKKLIPRMNFNLLKLIR